MVERIDDMVRTYGHRVALTNGSDKRLTYEGMACRVHQLASLLLENDIGLGSRVGVFQMPGPDWICSFLAVLRTGAACLPMDSRIGLDRLRLTVRDCGPELVLADTSTMAEVHSVAGTTKQVINISLLKDCWPEVTGPVQNQARPEDCAVISYTSGSTGRPKGILLRHASYRNFVEFGPPRWGFGEGQETVLQQSSYAFDMSLAQIFTCLGYGGTLVVPGDAERYDANAMCQLIASQKVTFTLATPTEYLSWIRHGDLEILSKSSWRGAISGGEPVTQAVVQALSTVHCPALSLVNIYGPTETTFGCADCVVPLDEEYDEYANALSPLINYSFYIVDEELCPVPVGVPGQVMIGGAGTGAGYLHHEELTREKFLRDTNASPFFQRHGWNMVHASGDHGRLNHKGRLILHGRTQGNTQVKIGGIRMDLEDIESTIIRTSYPRIRQAAVSLRQGSDSDVPFLVAFVVLESPASDGTILTQLPHRLPLPQYMRPSIVINLEVMPMTISNKLDRDAIASLPFPARSLENRHVPGPPGSPEATASSQIGELEQALMLLWREALPRDVASHHTSLDRASDFFHVGGSSLSLISLQSLIKDRLGLKVQIVQLFKSSTLEEMALLLQSHQQPIHQDATEPHEPILDWKAEIAIDSSTMQLAEAISEPQRLPRKPPGVIALTGSTGFLGKSILAQLTADPGIIKIYCLAIRRSHSILPNIFSHPKVHLCPGDLITPNLGMSPDQFARISDTADAIIHVGADTSFLKTYKTLRQINVFSTKEVVRLALPRRLAVHFVSTASVVRLAGKEEFGEESVAQYPPGWEDGYIASKWVCEAYLEQVNQMLGLPVVVHRPSNITGQDMPESDFVTNLIKHARETGTVADTSSWRGSLDFVSVESAAQTIFDAVMDFRNSLQTETRECIRYMYESGEVTIAVNELESNLTASTGKHWVVLPPREWVDVLAQSGMDPLLVAYLRRLVGGEILLPKLLKGRVMEEPRCRK